MCLWVGKWVRGCSQTCESSPSRTPMQMIQPFILRRSKRDVEKQLPKKYEHILKCRLSNRQKSLYEDVMTQPG